MTWAEIIVQIWWYAMIVNAAYLAWALIA